MICNRCQREASCHWLATHAHHHLFRGWCLNVNCDCVEVWCVPSALSTYSSWHHSVINCFETSLHVFVPPYPAFHALGIIWLCLHIRFLWSNYMACKFFSIPLSVLLKCNNYFLCNCLFCCLMNKCRSSLYSILKFNLQHS